MGKILAIVFLILFIWVAIPHIAKGEWIAPTAIAPNSWLAGNSYNNQLANASFGAPEVSKAAASPVQGYGWFHFDFWKHDPSAPGRVVTKSDFSLRL
ncbi:MAG: hypothetical protein ABIQ91_01190 [Candidatus Paceibacterota bacterium]